MSRPGAEGPAPAPSGAAEHRPGRPAERVIADAISSVLVVPPETLGPLAERVADALGLPWPSSGAAEAGAVLGEEALREMERALRALRLEVPAAVADDVERLYRRAVAAAEARGAAAERGRNTYRDENGEGAAPVCPHCGAGGCTDRAACRRKYEASAALLAALADGPVPDPQPVDDQYGIGDHDPIEHGSRPSGAAEAGPVLGEPWVAEVRQALASAETHPDDDPAEHVAGYLVNFVRTRESAAEERGAAAERERIRSIYQMGRLDLRAIEGGPPGLYQPAPEDTW